MNNTYLNNITTNFDDDSKCSTSKYYWTSWSSLTNPNTNDSDGNDYETLNRHRHLNGRFFIFEALNINIYHYSICEDPKEIDARVTTTNIDWRYSNSVLINAKNGHKWNIGISRYG